MRQLRFGLAILMAILPFKVYAASPSVVISELQTGSSASGSQEFVELYNPTSQEISLEGWSVEYKSATGTSWTKKSTLAGNIKPGGFFLIAPKSYLPADAELTTGLSGTAGHIRLMDRQNTVMDLLGWGDTADTAETSPHQAPAAGQSIERQPGRLQENGGNWLDTDDNSKDFVLRDQPQPQTTNSEVESPSSEIPVQTDEPESTPEEKSYLPISITELLVDPALPQTDMADEFVELYNSNQVEVDLTGYTLKAGSGFRDYYVIPEGSILPGEYLVIESSDSKLGLTNSGGAVQLLDPAGNVVSQTGDYPEAEEGQSWALVGGTWVWTLKVTPGSTNLLEQSAVTAKASATKKPAKTATAKKSTVKAASKSKVAAAKTTKPKSKVSKITDPIVAAVTENKAGRWLLITAIVATIGYGIYEFRYDLQNFYYKTRRKLGLGRTDRPSS